MFRDHHENLIDLLADLLANALEGMQEWLVAAIVWNIHRYMRPA